MKVGGFTRRSQFRGFRVFCGFFRIFLDFHGFLHVACGGRDIAGMIQSDIRLGVSMLLEGNSIRSSFTTGSRVVMDVLGRGKGIRGFVELRARGPAADCAVCVSRVRDAGWVVRVEVVRLFLSTHAIP